MRRTSYLALAYALATSLTFNAFAADPASDPQTGLSLPKARDGRALNLDFETGSLADWKPEGEAFAGQPVEGDTVYARRQDMKSQHEGKFWVGTFERKGDRPQGTLTSAPFVVSQPFARFLIAGGSTNATRMEIVRKDTGRVVFKASGDGTEVLKPVVADLSAHLGHEVLLRLVDADSGGWGHVNFDDFKLSSTKPIVPTRANELTADSFAHEGLSPKDAAAAMTVPKGFSVQLFAGEPDVIQPIAFAIDGRNRLWVAEAYSYPIRLPAERAHDRILIFEDSDNDGHFDKRTVFADKLNLVSGIEVGFGGVWVGAAPELLFIPDRDHDDHPDGPPEVILDGWGYHDTHETLNSFTWGPDGWLYGCHGVFTHSRVGKPGAPDAQRIPINAGIWRYHPTRAVFEVFAHGTSNPWGIDFDPRGQCFIEACVIPHLYHMVQGGRFERQAGPHFNPYTYDDIKTIANHRHYLGATPHGGNGKSEQAGGGHAHAGLLFYQGFSWPKEYHGSLLMNNIHGARLNRDVVTPQGSGFIGSHRPDFLAANDLWSQVVSLRSDRDGSVFMIDWYDKNQCHRTDPDVHDRANGRIFKIVHESLKEAHEDDLVRDVSSFDENMLVHFLKLGNVWFANHARRVLQERWPGLDRERKDAVRGSLAEILKSGDDETLSLRALWTLHACGGLSDDQVLAFLGHANPYVRAWTIQLACETSAPSAAARRKFADLAASDPSPVVRLYLASALQRLPAAERWPIAEALAGHAEDNGDHNLPLMVWYGAEPLAVEDPSRALDLALKAKLTNLLPFMVRRVAAMGTDQAIAMLVGVLDRAKDDSVRLTFLRGLNEALQGRREAAMPAAWKGLYPSLAASGNEPLRSEARALALTFGDAAALGETRALLADSKRSPAQRREALAALLKARDPQLPPVLQALIAEPSLRPPAIRALAAYEDAKTPGILLQAYPSLAPDEKRDALNTLAARPESGRALLSAVGASRVASRDLSADVVRQLRNLKDSEIDAQLVKVWGSVRETPAERARAIARHKSSLSRKPAQAPDVELGRAVFAKTCQQCHALFGEGSKIGPELTGSNRADLDYVLSNVLDPSSLIGKDYMATVVATRDGRVLTGIVTAENQDALTLQTANEPVIIPKAEVEDRRPSDQSMMPEDLWNPLNDHEVRSLIAYLASPSQVPMRATTENAAAFFNGRDLTGWAGDPALWSVEGGEIVGKTAGIGHNAFLVSALTASDFRLTLQVKLAKDQGNSGVQFRSASREDGEMVGYQADIGPGWWGKLYEENGRGLLWEKSAEPAVRKGEWNTYVVEARGSRIRTSINGVPSVDLDDPSGARAGVFALQLHSGGATEVRYKNLKLELIGETKPEATR